MISNSDIKRKDLLALIRTRKILFAGNRKLKIYGRLGCVSGKRMKLSNRVFFSSKGEATLLGFRPCKKCMRGSSQESG
jgi:methylphosphotriester-DNA--protein-cysteine methyltransferase